MNSFSIVFKKIIVVSFCLIFCFSLTIAVKGIKNKNASNENNLKVSQKHINELNKNFIPNLPFNRSSNVKEMLPKVNDDEVDFSPTLTEKLSSDTYTRDLWVTLSCQAILCFCITVFAYLVFYNRNIPISYEPHIRSKYHIRKNHLHFYKF